MRVLVAGANGQVGQSLSQRSSHDLVALDRSALDITQPHSIQSAIERHRPDVLINAAAYTAVDRAESESQLALAGNQTGPALLAAACARAGIPLLHISTDYVFDGSADRPYVETDPTQPLGVYGQTKCAGEIALRAALPEHIILRTSWVFSAHGANFVRTMLRLADARDQLSVVDDQFGGPTGADAIADALLGMVDRYRDTGALPWGTYHFSQLPHVSWHQFAGEIIRQGRASGLLDHDVEVVPVPSSAYPTTVERPKNSRLDRAKYDQAFGRQTPSWQTELTQVMDALSARS